MSASRRRARSTLRTLGTLAAWVALLGAFGGCASPGNIGPQAQPLSQAQAGIDAAAAPTPPLDAHWWQRLGDPALDALVERALAEQPTLKVAAARLARAQAALGTAQAAEGPQLGAAVDVTRQQFSANSIYPPPLGGSIYTLASAQLDASLELDLFGRQRAAIDAAAGTVRAAEADVAAARLVLASSVVRTWAQLARLHEQRDIAERTLAQRSEMLALIEQRVRAGLDSAVELHQGQGLPPDTRQQIAQLDEQAMLARHALAALTAQAPAALDALVPSLRPSAASALALPATLPAELLGRRADVNAARWRVEAASGDVRAARALFYPNVNLVAFAGVASLGLDRLVRAGSEQYGVGPALSLPLFDSGRLRANLRARSADLDAAVETYNAAVLDAVRDVADQLGTLAAIARQQRQQSEADTAAQAAYRVAMQRYRAGLGNLLVVLNTESAVLAQRRAAVDLRWRRLDTEVALVKALGGGYVADAGSPSSRAAAAPAPSPR
ncbi:MAG: efflux transporter outer membrane subunit [Burkholderiales bacterium]|nr:efflux transporter outer membrane subunit [Burkholderiales bacterium]